MTANPWVVDEPDENPWVVPEGANTEPPEEPPTIALPAIPEDEPPPANALTVYQEYGKTLSVVDEITKKSVGHFMAECTRAKRNLEAKRVKLVEPHLTAQREINKEYGDPRDAFESLAKLALTKIQQYDEQVRIAAELEQKRLNDLAELERQKLEQKEAALREEAERARAQGDEKAAMKLEQKAETTAIKAAEVVPQTVVLPSTKMDVGDGTLSTGAPKKTWNLPGWDKAKPIRVMERGVIDHRLAPLIAGSTLSPGMLFLLSHCDLNPVHLNKSYNGGTAFPKPFTEVPDYGKGGRLR